VSDALVNPGVNLIFDPSDPAATHLDGEGEIALVEQPIDRARTKASALGHRVSRQQLPFHLGRENLQQVASLATKVDPA
jgi:hypothetical protein